MKRDERIRVLKEALASTLNLLEHEGYEIEQHEIVASHRRRVVEWNRATDRFEATDD